jgi:hypothetical protein
MIGVRNQPERRRHLRKGGYRSQQSSIAALSTVARIATTRHL